MPGNHRLGSIQCDRIATALFVQPDACLSACGAGGVAVARHRGGRRSPREAILAAQYFIGIGVGVGYVGVTLIELRKDVLAGIAYVAILALLSVGFTENVVQSGLAGPVEGFLAFASGGQAEMTVLAFVAGADLGFVTVHHLTRIVIVITAAQLVAGMLKLRNKGKKQP